MPQVQSVYEVYLQTFFSHLQRVLKEMNRLGVMIDLSHVSVATMKDALQYSKAPVIFSHSSAYNICPSKRNVPDDVLQLVVRHERSEGEPLVSYGPCPISTPHPSLSRTKQGVW